MSRAWRTPLDGALHDGLDQVRALEVQGILNATQSEVLRQHLLGAWAVRRVNDLVAEALSPEKLAHYLREPARRT